MAGRRAAAWVVVGLSLGLLGGLLQLGTWPPVATVESDSMQPAFGAGDLLLLGRADDVAVGDVVVVPVPARLQSERGYPARLAHRVIEVGGGQVTTQGDRLAAPDPFAVPASDVSQRAVAAVPFAGHIVAFLRSPVGMLWLIGGLLVLTVRERMSGVAQQSAPTAEDLATLRLAAAALLAEQSGRSAPLTGDSPPAAGGTQPADPAGTPSAAAAAQAGEAARRALAGLALGSSAPAPEVLRDPEDRSA